MRRVALFSCAPIAAVAILTACASGQPINLDDDDDTAATLQTNLTSFVADPGGYFANDCLGTTCHEGTAPPGILVLGRVGAGGVTKDTIYTSLRTRPNVVNTANAAASTLLTKPIDTAVGHVGAHPWTDNGLEDQGITTWINRGAQND